MKNFSFFYIICLTLVLSSCSGTINTVIHSDQKMEFNKAVIVASENSQYIRFKPGIIIPTGTYIVLPDDPAEKHDVIGNTDIVIKQELAKYGIEAVIVKEGEINEDFDVLIEYHDTWRWDFKKVLDKLELVFISPTGEIVAKSTYNIYRNKELHNFPSPEKEVPKMLREILKK